MSLLFKTNNKIILTISDSPELSNNLDAKMFFGSILDYDFNEKTNTYVYDNIDDLIRTSKLIQNTVNFCKKRNASCNLDSFCQTILGDSINSERNFFESQIKGLEIKNTPSVSLELPSKFKRMLKPYQEKSVKHIVEVGNAANFSVPGSGKTTITYASYSIWKNSDVVDKIMVIGPRSSFMPWEEEFNECFDKPVISLRLSGTVINNIIENSKNKELILCTYQLMSNHTNDIIDFLNKYKVLLVLDESHHVKRLDGGLWSLSILNIAPYAKKRVILSGTPMPHSANDLWTQFTFLWPYKNLLGEPGDYKKKIKQQNGLGEFTEKIKPFYTRITKGVLGLKSPDIQKHIVSLKPIQQKIYDTIAMQILEEIESMNERTKLYVWRHNKTIRLLQAASNPSLLNEFSEEFKIPPLSGEGLPVSTLIEKYSKHEIPSKLIEAVKIAKDLLKAGEKVIIWTAFVHNIRVLEKELLRDENPLIIYGDIPKDENENELINREKTINEFKNDHKPRVLIANPSSCAESISLHKNEKGETVCKNAIYVDRTFNAGQYMQSLDRIHRIGLDPETQVKYIILIGKDTIDDVVDDSLNEKMKKMYKALNDDVAILNLESTIESVSDKELNEDFQHICEYLKKMKSEKNADQSKRN